MDCRDIARGYRWWDSLDEDRMVAIYDGIEIGIDFKVCPTCNGRGKYVNPSIDSNGIDPETFRDDPEFFEDYMNGAYDVRCEHCAGNRVYPVPVKKEDADFVNGLIASDLETEAIHAAERRMGA